ncbi:MAG: alpha-galactosidase [Chitinophagaceae bacterium]|nr:MAG: alpha-galactosidase [Chitinophagaceae bacterium]
MMKTVKKFLTLFLLFSPLLPFAQTIPLLTRSNALVLRVDAKKRINISYFGEKLSKEAGYTQAPGMYRQNEDYGDILNSAYLPAGSVNMFEPAIAVVHGDGNTSLDLEYVSHSTSTISNDVSLTTVILKDKLYPFQVKLFYKTYFAEDVMELWSSISHTEKKPVLLNKFASASLYLKSPEFWLRNYHGDWAKEMQPEETRITHGIKTLDTKLGTRANLFQPPLFMVSVGKPATEDEGSVLVGSVSWTGNFRVDLELDNQDNLRLTAGINNYQSAYTLKPKEEFETAKFLYTFSSRGKGVASRNLHTWARNYGMVDGHGSRMTLLNNWEATYFDFNETKLAELLKDTKKLGVDLFLLDDGWFANKYPRNDDHAGLGDWEENKKKLPNGISYLVKEATANDVKFGIWIEPEMVNPKSELYEKHPEWVIRQPGREEHYFRNQLVLDLTNPRVQDFVFGVVDDLLTKNPDMAYIKWDCNAVIYNAQSAFLTNQSHLYVDYVRGLYKVLERIRTKYPTIPLMLCSGGGGRVDYGALQYFTEYWPSDNTDPLERIYMQWEYSYFFPAIASSNHVTEWGKQSLKYRIDVAMMGKMGFDIVIGKLPAKELMFSQQAVRVYDSVKNVIWHGEQYRLSDPWSNPVASVQYVDSTLSTSVVFNYLVNNRYGQGSAYPVRLKGLDANADYRLREVNLFPGTKSPVDSSLTYSGDFLMKVGFNPVVRSGRNSVVLVVEKVK